MSKIDTINNLIQIINVKKAENKIIVAACGCFDLFHIGHLEYLQGAKKLGHVLIVGVNSNESIIKIKNQKPMFDISDRMRMIEALECVDYVFSFHDMDFRNMIITFKPDIFAKGIDRKNMVLPEQEICKKYKAQIMYIGEIKRSSSTFLKKAIQNQNHS